MKPSFATMTTHALQGVARDNDQQVQDSASKRARVESIHPTAAEMMCNWNWKTETMARKYIRNVTDVIGVDNAKAPSTTIDTRAVCSTPTHPTTNECLRSWLQHANMSHVETNLVSESFTMLAEVLDCELDESDLIELNINRKDRLALHVAIRHAEVDNLDVLASTTTCKVSDEHV